MTVEFFDGGTDLPPPDGSGQPPPDQDRPKESAAERSAAALDGADQTDENSWLDDDIERAYQQALQVVESVEWEVGLASGDSVPSRQAAEGEFGAADSTGLPPPAGLTVPMPNEKTDDRAASDGVLPRVVDINDAQQQPRVIPEQVIEAALFVGGTRLTIKKLCLLLRGEFDQDFVETAIDVLGARYADENRPYEIVFGEGGYSLVLRPEFDRVRERTFGVGPKEVKLSQEALEVLALVAYRQPISSQDVERAGKHKPGGVLRQLLRRQLIAIQRGDEAPSQVKYRTTPRFLEVFGLRNLDELPQSDDDFDFK